MASFNFNILKENNKLQVNLNGRIMQSEDSLSLLEEINSLLSNDLNRVILNLENLDYINSNGLNCFINILTKARNIGGEVVIINVPEKIQKLLLISKLNTVFTIKNTLEEAIEILN